MAAFVFCRGCGKQIHETAPTCPHCGAPQIAPPPTAGPISTGKGVDFPTSVKICFSKYASWKGRASRSEYWYFQLLGPIFTIPLAILAAAVPAQATAFNAISTVITLGLFLPGLAVFVRRLHDTNRSGWWFWLLVVPVIGWILVLVWFCTKGTAGDNQYGPDPLR